MKRGNLKSFADSRRLKYGTLNLIFIAMVIAIVIVFNTIVTLLSDALNWRVDMTQEQLYTVSDPCVELLDKVSGDTQIDIIFCCDKDKAEKDYTNTNGQYALSYVHSTATQIADRLDNVSILYVNPVLEYEFMKKFNQVSTQINPSEDTVIVARRDADGSYGTMYRTYHASSFYSFLDTDGSTPYGYSGERVFASAVLSLTYDKNPTVYFVTGNGEKLIDMQKQSVVYLTSIFTYCGFDIRLIDLEDTQYTCEADGCDETWGYIEIEELKDSDEITCSNCGAKYRKDAIKNKFNEERDIPTDALAVIINQPANDYTAGETNKLHHYLFNREGTVMCFLDPTRRDGTQGSEKQFENLYAFLKENAGVTVDDSDFVTDANTVGVAGGKHEFRGTVASSAASNVYLGALKGFGSSRPLFKNSGILNIDPNYSDEDGATHLEGDVKTQALIETSGSALFNDKAGKHAVMSVTSISYYKENQPVYSYLVVCPSGGFVADETLSDNMYPNEGIVMSLIHSTTNAQVPVDLDFKTFANYKLDITSTQATRSTVLLIVIPTVVIIALGVFVIVRRKHR